MSATQGDEKSHIEECDESLKNVDLNDDEEEAVDENLKDEDFIDEVALKDADTDATPEELEERKISALKFKEEGNTSFKTEDYTLARSKYTAALRLCPLVFEKERSILFANRGACNMKEGRRKEAIEDCSLALELNPTYLKALKRRAVLYEQEDKLDDSLQDYKKIIELDRTDRQAFEAVQRLPGLINERNEKLKTEMMGTLKDLGNKILRPFGLSTENFQLQQDPNSGGYTINFNKNNS